MNPWIRQPVTFNVITIASLAVFVILSAFNPSSELENVEVKVEVLLEQLAAESDAVDETVLASLNEAQATRDSNTRNIYLMIIIAVLSSFAANYFGRGRQHNNVARIRELEAQLDGKS